MSTLRCTNLQDTSGGNSLTTAQIYNGAAKAWVNFNGTSTVAIRASFNVSSITDGGTGGPYTINFTNALADANYATIISTGQRNVTSIDYGFNGGYNNTTTSTLVFTLGVTGSAVDWQGVNVAIFR